MKKRFLALFLMLGLLVTALPLPASAVVLNSVPQASASVSLNDYDRLYVQEGLVGLYTAYGANDTDGDPSLILEDGKVVGWADKIYGRTARVAGGFTPLTATGGGFGLSLSTSNISSSTLSSYIDFPDGYGDLDSFTVESIMSYEKPSGLSFSTIAAQSYNVYRIDIYSAMFTFGSLSGVKIRPFLSNATWSATSGSTRQDHFLMVNGNYQKPDGSKSPGYVGNGYSVSTGTVTNQTFIKETASSSVYLALLVNGATQSVSDAYYGTSSSKEKISSLKTEGTVSLETYSAIKSSTPTNVTGKFSMLNGAPGKMYAFRVYDHRLSAEETAINHFVDLAAYFDLDVSRIDPLSGVPDDLAASFASYTFSNGKKATLQGIIDAYAFAGTDKEIASYRDMYVTDGLVALFDAFSTDTISLSQAKWYALALNANGVLYKKTAVYATMEGGRYSAVYTPTGWRNMDGGGLGYTDPQNTASNTLSLPVSLISSDEFEVEAIYKTALRDFAVPNHVTTSFTSTKEGGLVTYSATSATYWRKSVTLTVTLKNTTKERMTFIPLPVSKSSSEGKTSSMTELSPCTLDAGQSASIQMPGFQYDTLLLTLPEGISLTSVSFPNATTVGQARADRAFVFGNLYVMVWSNKQGCNAWGNGYGQIRYHIGNADWTSYESGGGSYAVQTYAGGSSTAMAEFDGTMSILRATKSLNQTADTVSYSLYHNGDKYTISSTSASLSTSLFTLAGDFPSTLYSVRIYDRTLTENERKRNHTADLFAFSGADVSLFSALSSIDRLYLDDAVASLGFGLSDDDLRASILNLLDLIIEDSAADYTDLLVDAGEVSPLTDTVGYRALFSVRTDRMKLLSDLGYSVYYGAIVGAGNEADALTVSYADGSVTANDGVLLSVYGGDNASETFYRTSETEWVYSAAVRYDDAALYERDTVVRGFAVVVSPKGTVSIAYDAAKMPEDLHDMASLADYYVNRYDGNLTESRAHISNAHLCAVLSALGMEARKVAEGDRILSLYVDPNGSDSNLGTESAPYATLSRAVDRAQEAYAAGVFSVVIHLSRGVHRVSETLYINSEMLDERCELFIEGEGRDTILTSSRPIGTAEGGVISLAPGADGSYPEFRYLYTANDKGDLTAVYPVHAGDENHYRKLSDYPYVNKESKTVFLLLDADLFDGASSYEDTEIHFITEWDYNVIHIERVDYSANHPGGSQFSASGTETKVDPSAVPEGKVIVYVDYYEFENLAIPSGHTMKGKEYWIENSYDIYKNGSDTDSFYYDRATGKIYIYDRADDATLSSTSAFEIPTAETVLHIKGARGLTLSGFTVTGTDNRLLSPDSCYIGSQAGGFSTVDRETGVRTSYGFADTAAILIINGRGITLHDMYFHDIGGDAVFMRGNLADISITSSEFARIGQTAIRLGYNTGHWSNSNKIVGLEILNNYVHHTGRLFKQCCGILVTQAMEARIVGNTITDTTYTAISVGWRWNESSVTLEEIGETGKTNLYHVEIAYNYIASFMTCMMDGGGIYTLGGNLENDETTFINSLHHNYMVMTEETGKVARERNRTIMCYYHDGASSNWYDYENVIINATTTGIGNTIPIYVQHIAGQNAHNVTLSDNYAIGFTGESQVYRSYIVADRNIFADDQIFTAVSAMSADAKTTAAKRYAAAGSTLAPRETDGGLGVTADAPARTLIFDDGEVSTDLLTFPPLALRGDANGDGAVDGKDVIALRQYLVGNGEVASGADVNLDGTVDGKDVILLRRYLVGAEALPQ